MPVLESKLDTRSEIFQQNKTELLTMLSTVENLLEEASLGGGEEAIARLRSREKMPIRERISHALDRDSPFLEISPLAGWRSPFTIGSRFVVGIGVIENVECVILGHDPSVRAGAFNQFNSKKLMRGLEIALNFYIHDVLGEGVSSNHRIDKQAKTLCEYLRAKLIDAPTVLVDQIA